MIYIYFSFGTRKNNSIVKFNEILEKVFKVLY